MQPDTASALDRKQSARILIVDDHEISRAALRALLRTEGIDVADVRSALPHAGWRLPSAA